MSDSEQIFKMIHRAVVGKEDVSVRILLAILARGHILLEDMPGVGKTTLALAFSKALALDYSRMQFTPDVLPADVTGFSIYNKATGQMEYRPGAIICNLFLADELNRATSRTQSALLEAMEEGQVTVDGVSHPLPRPFVVLATQNPAGAAGTQLLPESQLDRFMVRLSLGYPTEHDELEILLRRQQSEPLARLSQVVTRTRLEEMRREADSVHVSTDLLGYIVRLVAATRDHPEIAQGASPRASLALTAMAKASAYVQGRDYVTPKDIAPLVHDTLAHRLTLRPESENGGVSVRQVLHNLVRAIPAPRVG